MELSNKFAGTRLKALRTAISPRHAMNHAASIGDMNPVYFDDTREGGCIAMPVFAVALTWPMIANLSDHLENSAFPLEVMMTMVHHTELLRFFRPLSHGLDLTIDGVVKTVSPHRAGTRVVLALDAKTVSGEPVFYEEMGAMLRGVACVCDGGSPEPPEVVKGKAWRGLERWRSDVGISAAAPYIYDGCTGIHFPIHTSQSFAKSVGLPGIIHQGTATLALAVREIVNIEAGGDPGRLREVSCRFTGMVFPGTDIAVSAHDAPGGVAFDVINADGNTVISDGLAKMAE